MVGQYPDSIEIKWRDAPYQDANGDWVKPVDVTVVTSKCRATALSAMGMIKSQSGKQLKHDYHICMPKMAVNVPVGAEATITRHDGLVIENVVKRSRNNFFNSQVWV